jgi:hypothetical protein
VGPTKENDLKRREETGQPNTPTQEHHASGEIKNKIK